MTDAEIQSIKQDWLDARTTLRKAKEVERELRIKLFKAVFEDAPNVLQRSEEHGLKGKIPTYYSLDQAAYEARLPELREADIPDSIVEYKPNIVRRNLEALPFHKLGKLMGCIHEKAGLVTLEEI